MLCLWASAVMTCAQWERIFIGWLALQTGIDPAAVRIPDVRRLDGACAAAKGPSCAWLAPDKREIQRLADPPAIGLRRLRPRLLALLLQSPLDRCSFVQRLPFLPG